MPVVPSSIVGVESSVESDDLWSLGYLLAADWGSSVVVSTSFQTDIATQYIDSEQRLGLINRGSRSVEVDNVSFNQTELLSLQSLIQRASLARSLFPLISDFSVLTSSAGVGVTTISCDTTNNRLIQGGIVAIVSHDYSVFTVRTIASLTGSTITLNAGLDVAYAKDSEVIPLIEAKLTLTASLTVKTDRTVACRLVAQELPGQQTLGPLQAPGTTPAGFSSYLSYPILSTKVNFREDPKIEMSRVGSFSGSGVSQVASVYGSRMRVSRSWVATFNTRATAFDLIRFFEGRAGRLFPFWVVSPTSDYQFNSYGSGTIKLKAVGPIYDWNFRPWIAVVANDGTTEIRTITNVSRASGEDTLTLDSAFTISAGQIARVCMAHFSRFSSDELKETWQTDQIMESTVETIELPAERSVSIANIRDPATTGIPSRFDILACQNAIKDGEADTPGGYSCEDCVLLDCHGNPVLDPDYGPPRCDVTLIMYHGSLRARTFFDGTEHAEGDLDALNLGAYCGCRREYVSLGTPCTLSESGSGTYVAYMTWWCFEFGEVQWDYVDYLDFCCCDDLPENQGCPRAG